MKGWIKRKNEFIKCRKDEWMNEWMRQPVSMYLYINDLTKWCNICIIVPPSPLYTPFPPWPPSSTTPFTLKYISFPLYTLPILYYLPLYTPPIPPQNSILHSVPHSNPPPSPPSPQKRFSIPYYHKY